MDNNPSQPPKKSTPCIGCGGSGQTSFFGGASRFMLTWEDCPDCHGTGVVLDDLPSPEEDQPDPNISKEL
ncbi:hypothetical protein [Desulforhopalus sp. IMCC35007]|uniref:hypothetical protein n=1 Tax=Desulforhopalus sp. IMCC35007 TaxID=2569543 RepID=UPI0010ADD769|nr:hypothetical protein [Desulforhopalus sp. IMCC35007]TKB11679.1 hypothetical protein FCL48_02470 [Desulforhopalus sp. IMCC35007]